MSDFIVGDTVAFKADAIESMVRTSKSSVRFPTAWFITQARPYVGMPGQVVDAENEDVIVVRFENGQVFLMCPLWIEKISHQ